MKKTFLFFIISVSISLFSCNNQKNSTAAQDPAINDSIIKNIPVASAAMEDDSNDIKLNGKISTNETKTARVYALISGRVLAVKAELGDFVKKGQVLAVLKSTEVASAGNDLSLAASNVEMTKKALQTTQDLYEGKLATEQDYINAKVEYNKALSELNKAKQVAAITGGSNATYTVTAPISGYIIEKNLTGNSEIRADNNASLFTIADLSEVWITANVYEADIMNIHIGDAAIVNTLADPDKNYPGKIDKIYNVLDPATRTMQVRVTMQNKDSALKPEMFVTVKVNIHSGRKILTIPVQSLIMDNSKYYVVVKKEGKLTVQEISLVKRTEDRAYIRGLDAGDQVVTSSQLFVYQALTAH